MKVILIIIGFLLVSGLVFYITTNQNKLASNKKEKYNESEIKKVNQKEFEAIRNKRLSTKPSDLNITLPNKKNSIYGVIIDWEIGGAIYTTVAFINGEAYIYLSETGSKNLNVDNYDKKAVKRFVNKAQEMQKHTIKTKSTPLPNANEVKFYLLTNCGIYTGQEYMDNFANKTSPWQKFFQEGNNLLLYLGSK